jgi:probable F420-dependent oxidoreductase
MKLGAVLPTCEIGNDPLVIRDFAQAAEELGYAYLLVYDHVLSAVHERRDPPLLGPYTENDPFHEPLVLLAYLAGVTERIELATGVLILPQRQTALVAKQCAEIALLSRGRLRLGVGTGWNWVEYEGLGQSWSDRGRRFDQQIDLLRRLWSEPVVEVADDFHRIDRAGINPRPTHPIPIWFGGMSKPAIQRAARIGDGFTMTAAYPPVLELARQLRDSLAAAGRGDDDFGLETILGFGFGAKAWHDARKDWEEVGVTHLSMRAMSSTAEFIGEPDPGFTSPRQHIEALEVFMREMRG